MNSNEVIKTLTKIALKYDEESEESRAIGRAIESLRGIEVITSDNEYITTICPHCHQVIDRNYSEWDEVYNNPEGELK